MPEINETVSETTEAIEAAETAEMTRGVKSQKHSTLSSKIISWSWTIILIIIIGVGGAFLISRFIVGKVVVDGPSMVPTLQNNEVVLIRRIFYKPDRGDIVVFKLGDRTLIKRCIGLAGDTVVIDYSNSSVTVNGNKINEDYLSEKTMDPPNPHDTTLTSAKIEGQSYEYTVPEGHIFVLGDNRNISLDSRSKEVGFINCDDVLGKVFFNLTTKSGM